MDAYPERAAADFICDEDARKQIGRDDNQVVCGLGSELAAGSGCARRGVGGKADV
jgi:hypothetical protein